MDDFYRRSRDDNGICVGLEWDTRSGDEYGILMGLSSTGIVMG